MKFNPRKHHLICHMNKEGCQSLMVRDRKTLTVTFWHIPKGQEKVDRSRMMEYKGNTFFYCFEIPMTWGKNDIHLEPIEKILAYRIP